MDYIFIKRSGKFANTVELNSLINEYLLFNHGISGVVNDGLAILIIKIFSGD